MKRLFLTILIIQSLNNYISQAQVKVQSSQGSTSNTYNITNSGDGNTLRAQGGTLRVHERQFVEVLNESGFASAVTVAAVSGYNVRVSNNQPVSSNVTVPDSVFVEFIGAGRLTINSGDTVTFGGGYGAARKRVFFGAGKVIVKAVSSVFPEHFGAKNDSTFDSGSAFQRAFDCFPPYSRGVVELASGAKYLINTTVYFPKGSTHREISLRGNDAFVYTTSNDTVLVINNVSNLSTGPTYPRHNIERLWIQQIGTAGTGTAVMVWNTVECQVSYCNITDFSKGIALVNTLQSGVAGWTEGNLVLGIRFNGCDTSIVLKNFSGGANSFRWNNFLYNQFGMGAASSRNKGKRIYGIATYPNANCYENNWEGNNFAALDSCFALYVDGTLQGSKAFITYEMFGVGAQDESGIIEFGSNTANAHVFFDISYEGLNRCEHFIKRSAGLTAQITGIRTVVRSDGNNLNRGITTLVNPEAFTRLESVLIADSLGKFQSTFDPNNSYLWVKDVTSSGQILIRTRNSQRLRFLDVESGGSNRLARFDGINIISRADTNDVENLNVRTNHYFRVGSNNGTIDSLKYFVNGVNGQLIYIRTVDDSVAIRHNANGDIGDPDDIETYDGRSQRLPAGTHLTAVAEVDGDGVFWRVFSMDLPIVTASWNPGSLDSLAVDSTDVTYFGAALGDPVEIGFSSISHSGWEWHLSAYAIAEDTIRVYLKRIGSGSRNLASGTLRFKVVK